MPCKPRVLAMVSPTGPAPTTITSASKRWFSLMNVSWCSRFAWENPLRTRRAGAGNYVMRNLLSGF
jgi:hypothetical protein